MSYLPHNVIPTETFSQTYIPLVLTTTHKHLCTQYFLSTFSPHHLHIHKFCINYCISEILSIQYSKLSFFQCTLNIHSHADTLKFMLAFALCDFIVKVKDVLANKNVQSILNFFWPPDFRNDYIITNYSGHYVSPDNLQNALLLSILLYIQWCIWWKDIKREM